jgi:type IV pilus assembly protein PilN
MIRINLLPFRAARRKENIRHLLFFILFSVGLVVAALVWYHTHLNGKVRSLNAEIKETIASLGNFQKITRDIARMRKAKQIIDQKLEVIKKLETGRKASVGLLDAMTRIVVPKRMWFTYMGDKRDRVNIKGNALDNKTVADFMTRLEGSGLFASVNLQTLSQRKLGEPSVSIQHFEIDCTKKSDAKPADKMKAKK